MEFHLAKKNKKPFVPECDRYPYSPTLTICATRFNTTKFYILPIPA